MGKHKKTSINLCQACGYDTLRRQGPDVYVCRRTDGHQHRPRLRDLADGMTPAAAPKEDV